MKKILIMLQVARQIILTKFFHKLAPVSIKIFVTSKCNLRCAYCYALIHEREFGPDMTRAELFGLINQLARLGTKVIVLQGGEPLLRVDIGEIISYVKARGRICEMITNGYFVKDRIADLKKLDSLCISIDGSREETEFYRGEGSYGKAMEAINVCRKERIPVRLHSVITRKNMHSLEVFELAKSLNLDITVSTITTSKYHCVGYDPNFYLTPIETRWFWCRVRNFKRAGYPIKFSYSTLDYFIHYPFADFNEAIKKGDSRLRQAKGKFYPCARKYLSPEVLADGTIYPCAKLMHNLDAPNLRKVSLRQALRELKNIDCVTCGSITDFELNALLNLKRDTVMEVVKYYLKAKKKRSDCCNARLEIADWGNLGIVDYYCGNCGKIVERRVKK